MRSHQPTTEVDSTSARSVAAASLPRAVLPPPVARITHAFLLVPNIAPKSPGWFPVARFALAWQLRWLRARGIPTTLVASDRLAESPSFDVRGAAAHADAALCRWSQLGEAISGAMGPEPTGIALVMVGPLLSTCNLDAALLAHMSRRCAVTVICQRGRAHDPMAYLVNANCLAPVLPSLVFSPSLFTVQLNAAVLKSFGRIGAYTTRFQLVRSGDRNELRRLARLWNRCAPAAGLLPVGRRGAAFQASAASAIAPTARLVGPVFIDAGVTVAERAHVGPWALLAGDCEIGRGAWVETSVVGRGATIEPQACVYASIVAPHTCVPPHVPVLKAHLPIAATPELLPGADTEAERPPSYILLKRLMDIVIASCALVCLSPLLCLAMLSCLLVQGWPILFLHERLGRHGKHFRVLKVRTMHRNSHLMPHVQELEATDRHKLSNDPRITAVGRLLRKTSIDELPQLLNVLAGTMTIVGPRPIVPKEVLRYGLYGRELLRVTPGITGLWQVSGRSNTTYAQRVMFDVQYGDRCSLWLDLAILLRSVPAVLFLRGAV